MPEFRVPQERETGSAKGDTSLTSADLLAWDGQRFWSVTAGTVQRSGSQPNDSGAVSHPSTQGGPTLAPPLHLVCIDVGLARKDDTDERYGKALAFERNNGTLKALAVFEQIYTDDPSAVEVRNHVAWALATRPDEPYHNLDKALGLVNEALQWQPWNPEFWDTLAEIYWRKGDAKLAERLEAKAINLNPHKTFYWEQLDKFRAGPASQSAPEPSYTVTPRP